MSSLVINKSIITLIILFIYLRDLNFIVFMLIVFTYLFLEFFLNKFFLVLGAFFLLVLEIFKHKRYLLLICILLLYNFDKYNFYYGSLFGVLERLQID